MIPVHFSYFGDLTNDFDEDYPHADDLAYQHRRASAKHRENRRERRELEKARKEARQ
jgi:hypothetical protein